MRRVILFCALALALSAPASAIVVARVTVGTTATLLYTAPGRGGKVLVRNPSAVSVYLGPAGVTTATGFELAAGDALSVQVFPRDTVYAVVAAATQVVHTLEGNLTYP